MNQLQLEKVEIFEMSRLKGFINRREVRKSLLLLFLVLPTSSFFTLWFTDSLYFEEGYDDNKPLTPKEREQLEHLEHNLENVKCPAQKGRQLLDYWECLWRTSITVEGTEQHRRILAAKTSAYDDDTQYYSRSASNLKPKRKKRETSNRWTKLRVKRDSRPWNDVVTRHAGWYKILVSEFKVVKKMDALLSDSMPALHLNVVRQCQQRVAPGYGISYFWQCIQAYSKHKYTDNSTYGTTAYPKFKTEYNQNELKLLKLKEIMSENEYSWAIDFKRLTNEENIVSPTLASQYFKGADPYIDEDASPFLYRHNNLVSDQRQPAWTYGGLYEASRWHELDSRKFFVPMKKSTNLDGIEYQSDLAQSYPGIGDVAALIKKLRTPIDYHWSKDSGYSTYTRFLLPLITKKDLAYYKSKGLIEPSVTMKPEPEVIQDIINGLQTFLNETANYIAYPIFPIIPPGIPDIPEKVHPNIYLYTKEQEIPYVDAYKEFMGHFFHIDIAKYKGYATSTGNSVLYKDFEIVRSLLRAYVEVANSQEICMKLMLTKYKTFEEEKLNEKKPLEFALELLKNNGTTGTGCNLNMRGKDAPKNVLQYEILPDDLFLIYKNYYARKKARQRYGLPLSPIEFKPCRQTDQSPLNILTHQGRKSSLKDYVFSESAYRLNRFFMFFPLDSSTLLTVGIVDGQRHDGSSVTLFGGAIKGHNLTFQYMHIRFGSSWKAIGSEHWIDGKGASMELQMVFTIAGSADFIKYWHVLARVQNQLFQFRGKLVIILSVLVDVLDTDDNVKQKIDDENLGQDPYLFEPLAQAAYHYRRIPGHNRTYQHPRGYVSLDPVFRFIDFIPRKSCSFYTYRGSLSWPPCFGYVVWSVYAQRLYMSKRQFDQFLKIPAYGINSNNLAYNNIRRFEDIYVEQEHNPKLDYETIQGMIKQRTIDRHVLVGHHEVMEDRETDSEMIVGEEIYYSNEVETSCAAFEKMTILQFLTYYILYMLVLCIWMKIWQAFI